MTVKHATNITTATALSYINTVDHIKNPKLTLPPPRKLAFGLRIPKQTKTFIGVTGKTCPGGLEVHGSDLCSKNGGPHNTANFKALDKNILVCFLG